ncbi:MAG: hypothetical protein AAF725_14185 [Acidobacteriota bacterium]
MSRFEIEIREPLRHLSLLALSGRCIAAVADTLQEALDGELAKQPRGLLVDGSRLEELEGPCLIEILQADRQLRARHGGLALFALPAVVMSSLKQADLLDEVAVHRDFAAARQALEAHIRNARTAAAAGAALEGVASPRRRRRRRLDRRQGQALVAAAAQILG